MTIPGRGDLSPRRKHRNWRRRAGTTVALLVLAGGGYLGYRHSWSSASKSPEALRPCPTATSTPAGAQIGRLVVRNATLKTGLATHVAQQLRQRHFRVAKPGNTLFRGKGVASVRYSVDRVQAARLVAAQFAGATLVPAAGTGVLEVDIGPRFRALVPVAQAQAAERVVLGTSSPSPAAAPTRTCAPLSPKVTRTVNR